MNLIERQKNFIKKAVKIHNNEYDYSFVNYVNNTTKIRIMCSEHGIFEQIPNSHLRGCGCQICGGKIKLNNKSFIKKAIEKHGKKYNYSLIKYINAHVPIKIICPKHGVFEQKPYKHLQNGGCNICGNESKISNYIDILNQMNRIHNNKYIYDETSYFCRTKDMLIYCKKHKLWFKQSPHSHLKGYGCPNCSNSIGEKKIGLYLRNMGVEYVTNKIFVNCKNIKPLPFDFYLPKQNILIEFDGEQHFKPKNFGGISNENALIKFKKQKLRDNIKNKFTEEMDITLIRISDINNITNSLKNI